MKKTSLFFLLLQVNFLLSTLYSEPVSPLTSTSLNVSNECSLVTDEPLRASGVKASATLIDTVPCEVKEGKIISWGAILRYLAIMGEKFYLFELFQSVLFLSVLSVRQHYASYSFLVSVAARSLSILVTLVYIIYLWKYDDSLHPVLNRDLYAKFICPMISFWFGPLFMVFCFPSTKVDRPWYVLLSTLAISVVIIVLDKVVSQELPYRVLEILITAMITNFGLGMFYQWSYITHGFSYATINALVFWISITLFTMLKILFGNLDYDNVVAIGVNLFAGLPIMFVATRMKSNLEAQQKLLFTRFVQEEVDAIVPDDVSIVHEEIPSLAAEDPRPATFMHAICDFYLSKSKQAGFILKDPGLASMKRKFQNQLLGKYQEIKDTGRLESMGFLDHCETVALGESIWELLRFMECSSDSFSKTLVGRFSGF